MKILSRKWTWLILFSLLVAMALVLASPYWLPVVGKTLARGQGVEWQSIEAKGFSRFQLTGVSYEQDGIRAQLDTLSIPQPLSYAASLAGLVEGPSVEAGSVTIRLRPGDKSAEKSGDPVGPEILATVQRQLQRIQPWMPELRIGELVIGPPGKDWVRLQQLHWSGFRISGRHPGTERIPATAIDLWYGGQGLRFSALPLDSAVASRLRAAFSESDEGYELEAGLFSEGVPLTLDSTFARGLWMPSTTRVQAVDWPVPGFLLEETEGKVLNPRLSLDLQAQKADYTAELRVAASAPGREDSGERVISEILLEGNAKALTVSRLSLESDWLNAHLSSPVEYIFASREFSNDADFALTADLAQQDWLEATGTLEASLSLRAEGMKEARTDFDLRIRDFGYATWTVPFLEAAGRFQYPELELESFAMEPAEGSRLSGSATAQLPSWQMEARGDFRLTPEALEPYAQGVRFLSALEGEFRLSGEPESLRHEGVLYPFRVEVPGLHKFSADSSWNGTGVERIETTLRLESVEAGLLDLDLHFLAADPLSTSTLEVKALHLTNGPGETWQLKEPFSVRLDPEQPYGLGSISPFSLEGADGHLAGAYSPAEDSLQLSGANIDLARLGAWSARPLPPVVIQRVDLNASRLRPWLESTLALDLQSRDEDLQFLSLSLDGALGENGVEIVELVGTLDEQSFIEGNVVVPIRLHPFPEPGMRFLEMADNGQMEGSLTAGLTEKMVSEHSGIPFLDELSGIRFDLALGGTLDAPEARVEASLPESGILARFDERFTGMRLRDLDFLAVLTPERLRVERLTGKLEGATAALSGAVPTSEFLDWFREDERDWRQLLESSDFEVRADGLDLAPFAEFLPSYMRPAGTVRANLEKKRGVAFTGTLRMRDLSLRPTLYTQTVSGILLELELSGSRLDISEAQASIGESTVELDGYMDFADLRDPTYRIQLTGKRTPLVRTPDLLLHADIDLTLDGRGKGNPAELEGSLLVRDSVMLMDIDPLAARTAGGSLPRPPFFSIDQDPFSAWLIDIDITGDEALRLKSQYVQALLSAQFKLDGTLGSPVLVGEVFTSDGRIEFPGTRLAVSRSEIFVTRDQQDALQLDIQATGQTASHIVSMKIRGTAMDPQVEFSSTPSLSNARIFNLLATGSLDGSGLSSVGLYLGKGIFGPGGGSDGLLDRLSVDMGRDITESGASTIDIYYRLTDDLRLHGEYDKYDAQNIDLEWEVFSR